MTPRGNILTSCLVIAAAVALYAAEGLVDPLPGPRTVDSSEAVEPTAGRWVCPLGDGRPGTDLTVMATRPPGEADAAGQVRLTAIEDGGSTSITERSLVPGSLLSETNSVGSETNGVGSETNSVGSDGAVAADWWDGPVAVHRQWLLEGRDGELPEGIVAGGCIEPFSDRWIIPGMDTSGGAQAILRFANPFRTDATIGVSFVSPEGPLQPLALRNLSVESRGTLELDVNAHLPERRDLTAIVSVAGGRVGVEGLQLVRSAIGGIDGVSLLAAAAESSEVWTVPWVVDGVDLASWLWIHNPGERQALVELTYHTADGGMLPDGLAELAVDPGELQRVDLRGTFPEGMNVVGVTARSDGAPIVVSAATQLASSTAERSSLAVQLGAPTSDVSWTVAGGSTDGRVEQLHLINPAGVSANAAIALSTGSGLQRPLELQDLTIAPGSSRVVDLSELLGDVAGWAAFVTVGEGSLVVGRVGSDTSGPRRLVATNGIPSATWTRASSSVPLTYDGGFLTRFATSLGSARPPRIPDAPAPMDPGSSPSPEPDPPTSRTEPPGTDQPEEPDDGPDGPTPEGSAGEGIDEVLFGRTSLEVEGEVDEEVEGSVTDDPGGQAP